jgi:hypothetical protein
VRWPLLCLCRPFCIVERCLDSNPESCCSKLVRCLLSNPSLNFATHLLTCHPSSNLATYTVTQSYNLLEGQGKFPAPSREKFIFATGKVFQLPKTLFSWHQNGKTVAFWRAGLPTTYSVYSSIIFVGRVLGPVGGPGGSEFLSLVLPKGVDIRNIHLDGIQARHQGSSCV